MNAPSYARVRFYPRFRRPFHPIFQGSDKFPTTTLAIRYIHCPTFLLELGSNISLISVFVLTSSGNSSSFDPAVRRRRKLIYTTLQHIVDWRINNFTDPDHRWPTSRDLCLLERSFNRCLPFSWPFSIQYMIDTQTATRRFETSKI